MIISENPIGKENCVAYFDASVIENYMVLNADGHFYNFAGKLSGISFLDIVHPDHIRDFKLSFEKLKPGESLRMLILIKSSTSIYYWSDLVMTNKNRTLAGEKCIDIRCFILSAVESRYLTAMDNINKYRALLAIHNNILFDYNVVSGMFTIFTYQGTQSLSLIKINLDELRQKAYERLRRKSDREDFDVFYNYVKSGSSPFICNVCLPTDKEIEHFQRYQANGTVTYTELKNPLVSGFIVPTVQEEQKTIPYYKTKEAIDPPTGLLNKRAAMEYSVSNIANDGNNPHYMAIIDVDNFKSINDNYGHFFGDEVLAKVADIIKCIVNGRGVCGRFGGDEFYIFTNNVRDEEELRVILTIIRRELLYAYEGKVQGLNVTLSVGVSLYPNDGKTYEELFKKADKCLYLAKLKGRNRFIIYDENKHGAIEDEGRLVHQVLNLSEHAEYMAGLVSDAIIDIGINGEPAIQKTIETLFEKMEFDGVRIYEDNKLLRSYGDYKKQPDMTDVLKDEVFLKKYNSNNTMSIGNIASAEGWNKLLYETASSCNIMAFISFWFEFNGRKFYFFYDVFNHKSRWNDNDKNYMLILSKMFAKFFSEI